MPTVNGKEYPYTEAGIAAAAAANEENRRKEMPNFRQQSGWRSPMEQGMQQSFPQMPMIDPRTGTVMRPPNPVIQPPVMQPQPVPPMQGQQPGPPMQGQQPLTPEMRRQQNEMMQQLIRQKQLEQMFRQREMRGLLSDPGSVVRPGEMRPDPRSVVRPQEMRQQDDWVGSQNLYPSQREQEYSDPRDVLTPLEQEYFDPRAMY